MVSQYNLSLSTAQCDEDLASAPTAYTLDLDHARTVVFPYMEESNLHQIRRCPIPIASFIEVVWSTEADHKTVTSTYDLG
jgi:hypothetical protein